MVWYENYKWKQNPFGIEPVPDTFIIEDIRSRVTESVYAGDILNLYGQTGTGKTSLLRMLEVGLRGKFVLVYIDPLDLENYAPPRTESNKRQYFGFLGKLSKDALKSPLAGFRKLFGSTLLENLKATYKGKKLVLLIDEAKDITDPTIPSYFRSIKNSGADCSIIITSIDPLSNIDVFKDSLRDVRVRYLQMRTISLDEAKLMMRKRIEHAGGRGIEPFDERTLKYLVEISNNTPILILKNAEEVLDYLSLNGRSADALKTEDISAALMYGSPKLAKSETPKIREGQDASAARPQVTEEPNPTSIIPFENLTDSQQKIVRALSKNPLTAEELCKSLDVEYGSIFPQLYRLMLQKDVDMMKRKGISRPILTKTKEKPARYILDAEWKLGLVKE